jgi:hypothetical protein
VEVVGEHPFEAGVVVGGKGLVGHGRPPGRSCGTA